ncbi:zinc ribbon domain-containing protein [Psychrobacter submarinus]|uniref:zinc ribbon domain-containing protein n=1 Tax=Psychrobacter submarinus TaxID=154108 RepID=UPI001D100883|nr:zinc ribbon domain-containing protein [Psychrobacter submarinus]
MSKVWLRTGGIIRAISDLGFFEFKRQPFYKATEQGKVVKSVGPFYPSSKPVQTAIISSKMSYIEGRVEQPNCQVSHDRDLNASINILNNATVILTAA